MFASMSSGVAIYEARENGTDFVVKELNSSAERIVRSTQAECLGVSICEVFPGVGRLGLFDVIERVWRTGVSEYLSSGFYEDERRSIWVENLFYDFVPGRFLRLDDVTARHQALADPMKPSGGFGSAQSDILPALGAVANSGTHYTGGHQQRVAKIALLIGRKWGSPKSRSKGLSGRDRTRHRQDRSPHRDLVGSRHIEPDTADARPAPRVVGLRDPQGISFDRPVAEIVRQHHERLDGSGYPQGLRGDEIMTEARMLGVADTAEAMISHRPYRPARGVEAALEELRSGYGRSVRSGRCGSPAADRCQAIMEEGLVGDGWLNLDLGPE